MSKRTISNIPSLVGIAVGILSIVMSFFALYIAKEANRISNDSNSLATESKNISKEGLDFAKDSRSQNIVETAYSNLYEDDNNRVLIFEIRENKPIGDNNQLLRIIDIIEEVGMSYCQGTAWNWHINLILKNTLSDICNNEEILNNFGGKKNGTAILCYEYHPDSLFAKTINMDNINTCRFYDSNVFPNSG